MNPTHLFHSDERRASYSPCSICYEDSPVGPDTLLKDHMNRKTEYKGTGTMAQKSETVYESRISRNSNHVAKSQLEKNEFHKSKYFKYSSLDSTVENKVKNTKNKNLTLRLAKRTCENTWTNSLIEVEEQKKTRDDVPGYELQTPSTCDAERDENTNESHRKDYKDFIVLSSDKDYGTSMVFREDLLKLDIPNLTVDHFAHVNPGKTEMQCISSLHEQYNTVLIFVTHNYTKDKLRRLQTEMLVRKGLETKGLEHWVVPIWVEKDANMLVHTDIPYKGIQFYQLKQNKSDFSEQIRGLVESGRERPIC